MKEVERGIGAEFFDASVKVENKSIKKIKKIDLHKSDSEVVFSNKDLVKEETKKEQADLLKRQSDGLTEFLTKLQDNKERDEQTEVIMEVFKDLVVTDKGKDKKSEDLVRLAKEVIKNYKSETSENKVKSEAEAKKQIEQDIQAEAKVLAEKLGKKLEPILGETGSEIVVAATEKQSKMWLEKIKEKGKDVVAKILADAISTMDETESMDTVRKTWNKLPQWAQETMVGLGTGGEIVRYSMIPILKDVQSWIGLAVQTGLLEMKGKNRDIEIAAKKINASQKREVWVFNAVVKIFGASEGLDPKKCEELTKFVKAGVNTRQDITDLVRAGVLARRAATKIAA